MKKRVLIVLTLVLLGTSNFAYSQSSKKTAAVITNQMVSLSGRVLTKPANGEKLVSVSYISVYFQRIGCKKCISSVRTDGQGFYRLLLSQGKYRVFVFDTDEQNNPFDIISANQTRIFIARSKESGTQFDIEITGIRPKNFPPIGCDTN